MEMYFFPECYFDTVLVKHILKAKKVNHQKTCDKVAMAVQKIDDFAVGIIDKDKKVVGYLGECVLEIELEGLYLWKHKAKQHFIIQLAPAIERWILKVIEEGKVDVEDLKIPLDLEGLKEYTKYQFVSEDDNLKRLCKRLINSESKTMGTLTLWLKYLYEHNRNADINEMKKWD